MNNVQNGNFLTTYTGDYLVEVLDNGLVVMTEVDDIVVELEG